MSRNVVVVGALLSVWLAASAESVGQEPMDSCDPGIKVDLSSLLRTAGTGRLTRLGDLSERLTVLYVFATWAPSAGAQIQALRALTNQFRGLGVAVVGIDLDAADREVGEFAREYRVSFPILLAARKPDFAASLLIKRVPTILIINREGSICRRFDQAVDQETLARHLRVLLANPRTR